MIEIIVQVHDKYLIITVNKLPFYENMGMKLPFYVNVGDKTSIQCKCWGQKFHSTKILWDVNTWG